MSLTPFLKSEKYLNAFKCMYIFMINLIDYTNSAKINDNAASRWEYISGGLEEMRISW